MKVVEYWQWRYREPKSGRMCRCGTHMTEAQAAQYPGARRISSTKLMVPMEDFADTTPGVHDPVEPDRGGKGADS